MATTSSLPFVLECWVQRLTKKRCILRLEIENISIGKTKRGTKHGHPLISKMIFFKRSFMLKT
jgi:hypothetical protein